MRQCFKKKNAIRKNRQIPIICLEAFVDYNFAIFFFISIIHFKCYKYTFSTVKIIAKSVKNVLFGIKIVIYVSKTKVLSL